jgi:hypothetical protein
LVFEAVIDERMVRCELAPQRRVVHDLVDPALGSMRDAVSRN